jgi:signal transduction histidine kinase
MRLRRLVFIILGFVFLLDVNVKAKDKSLLIDSESKFFNPSYHIAVLPDPENTLVIQDILKSEVSQKFQKYDDEVIHLENSGSSYWLKFNIRNFISTSPYLEINNIALDTIEYFLLNSQGILVHHEITGNSVKVQDRAVKSAHLLINMHLEKNELYTCFIKVNATAPLIVIPLRIASLEKFYESIHGKYLWLGIYFGLILFLFVYNLFLFISIRDTSYLFFSLFIGCTGLLFSLNSGIGKALFWESLPTTIFWVPVLGAASSTLMVLFSARFLNSRIETPKLHPWLVALMIINIPLILLNIFGFSDLAVKLILYNSVMSLFFLMFLAVKSWRSGYQPAKFYLLSWSFHVLGIVLSLFVESMIIELDINVNQILQISSIISIFFMSFALSKKINIYIERRNEAQKLMLKTVMENEKLISNQNQLLEAKVHQRTIDLEQTISTLSKQRKDLHDANSFKDKVFSIISHDLKSPITSLAGLLQIMKMKTLNEEERSRAIDSLEIALKGARNLLDNILAWANKNRNASDEVEEIELYGLVEEIFQIFQFQAESKSIRLDNLVEPGFHIISNRDMLQLVIRNLVSNALKFTKKNGSVEIGMRQDYLNIEIFVKDSGVGMSEEMISSLFKSNRHNSTRGTENEKGTGLGLMLCKEFVEKHNGSIHVKSQLKVGSTFTLTLNNAVPILETVFN